MKRLTLILATLAVAAPNASAQSPDTTRLDTVVISAARTPRPVTTLTQPVTIISGADLRARGVARVSDALREVPGAAIVQTGSYGAVTSLFLRGGESRYTKVLIDGVAVNSAGGFFDFSHLTTDNVERIEIVRGPASVLYGADAVSGVIQIFTRKGTTTPQATLTARGGTYGTLEASGEASGGIDRATTSVGAGLRRTDGILPFNNQYHNGTLSSALRFGTPASGNATISARYTAAEFHYPTDFAGSVADSNAYRTQHRLTVGFDAGRNISSNLQARLLAGSNDVSDLTEDINPSFDRSTLEKSRFHSRAYRRHGEGRLILFGPLSTTLSVGAVYEKERENSNNASGDVDGPLTRTDSFEASRTTVAYYSELLGDPLDWLAFTMSTRLDDNSDYDRFATYRVGANLKVIRQIRVRGSLSSAFNAPAFSQLRPTLYTVGSPDLAPERIRSAEIGVVMHAAGERLHLSANLFRQRFAELIQYVSGGPPSFKGSYANLTAATANGYEAELRLDAIGPWFAGASYTVVRPRVEAVSAGYAGGDRPGDALLRRPSHSGAFTVGLRAPSGRGATLTTTYTGRRPDMDFAQFPSPRVSLPAYTKLDIAGEVPLPRAGRTALSLTGRIENLLDESYEEVLHFAAPGRTILVGGRARF